MKENELQKEIRKRIMQLPVVCQVKGNNGQIFDLITREEVLSVLLSDPGEKMR